MRRIVTLKSTWLYTQTSACTFTVNLEFLPVREQMEMDMGKLTSSTVLLVPTVASAADLLGFIHSLIVRLLNYIILKVISTIAVSVFFVWFVGELEPEEVVCKYK